MDSTAPSQRRFWFLSGLLLLGVIGAVTFAVITGRERDAARATSTYDAAFAATQAANATLAQGESLLQAQTAQAANATSDFNLAFAATQAAHATAGALTATVAQGQALDSAETADALQATRDAEASTATAIQEALLAQAATAQKNSAKLDSLLLANAALQALDAGATLDALLLAVEANRYPDVPPEARRALYTIMQVLNPQEVLADPGALLTVDFSPDFRQLLVNSLGGSSLQIYDLTIERWFSYGSGHTDAMRYLLYSPDGNLMVSTSADTTLMVWDALTRKRLYTLRGHTAPVNRAAFSPDGRTVLTASDDDTLILWDVTTGQQLRRYTGHSGAVLSVAFSPDGRTVLSGGCGMERGGQCVEGELILWDVELGTVIRRRAVHTDAVTQVAYSPDGRTVISGSSDHTLIQWSLDSGAEIRRFVGHTGAVAALDFSHDGRWLVSGSEDTTFIVWDVETGALLRQAQSKGALLRVKFSADGAFIYSADAAGGLYRWQMQTVDEAIQWAYIHYGLRYLTCDERARYLLSAGCDAQGTFPTRTPYASWTPSATSTLTPTPDFSRVSATPTPTLTATIATATYTPTATPTPTRTPTATRTPSPTASPTAQLTLDDRVVEMLAWAGIDPDSGTLADTIESVFVRNDGADDRFSWQLFDGFYADFAAGTTFLWGPGAQDDYCGFIFRRIDDDNFYLLKIDRFNRVYLEPKVDGVWQETRVQLGNTTALKTGPTDSNTVLLVAVADTFLIYINGELAGNFSDDSLVVGGVGVSAGTYLDSTVSNCRFTDSWVYRFTNTTFTIPTAAPLISGSVETMLAWAGLEPESGSLAEQMAEVTVDNTDYDNRLWWYSFRGRYTDFVVGATIARGPGAREDYCGFLFRATEGNMYSVQFNGTGDLWFAEQTDGVWGDSIDQSGRAVRTGQNAQNQLMLVARGDTFTIYVNGEISGVVKDNTLESGYVMLEAATYGSSDETYCAYTDAWVWTFPESLVSATLTPTASSAAPEPLSVSEMLAWATLDPDSGSVTATIDRRLVDVSGRDFGVNWYDFEGEYGDFAAGFTMQFWNGPDEDGCGIVFRKSEDDEDYYFVEIDRFRVILFEMRLNREWEIFGFGDGSELAIRSRATNQVLLVAEGDTFTLYINGEHAGNFSDDTLTGGTVGLAAITYGTSGASNCLFSEAWLWQPTGGVVTAASRTPVPEATRPPSSSIVAMLGWAGITPESGFVGDEIASTTVDNAGQEDVVNWEDFDGTYDDFVAGSAINWGPGQRDDYCGFAFRRSSRNAYLVSIDREGKLLFDIQVNGTWRSLGRGDGSAIRTGSREVNRLLLVAVDDTFIVYLNGTYAGQFVDDTHREGIVSVHAGTYTGSDESSCTFTGAFVWDLAYSTPDTTAPTPRPTTTSEPIAAPSEAIIEALASLGVSADSGHVGDQIDSALVSISTLGNFSDWRRFDGQYGNFIAATHFGWGPGENEDGCGLTLRETSIDDLYAVRADRYGSVWLEEKRNGIWRDSVLIGLRDSAGVHTRLNDDNLLMLVAVEDTVNVYMNGQLIAQLHDLRTAAGSVGLIANSGPGTSPSSCSFSEAWVWTLTDAPLELPAPSDARVTLAGLDLPFQPLLGTTRGFTLAHVGVYESSIDEGAPGVAIMPGETILAVLFIDPHDDTILVLQSDSPYDSLIDWFPPLDYHDFLVFEGVPVEMYRLGDDYVYIFILRGVAVALYSTNADEDSVVALMEEMINSAVAF